MKRKLIGAIKIIRPVNCLMMGLAVLVGAFISVGGFTVNHNAINLALGFIAASTLTGASMAINDYYDREIDAINEPSRPIPSGLIKPMESIALATLLSLIGLISAALTNLMCLLLASLSWLISVLYSAVGKRTGLLGNFLVSACVSLPFIYGGVALKGLIEPYTALFAALAFLANTGREITKGIVDVEGDRAKGIKTLALLYGSRRAAQSASAFFISAVLLSPIPLIFGLASIWFLPPLITTDIGFIYSSIRLLRSPTRENARKVKNTVLIWMAVGLIAFISGLVK
ncbi:MAG: geranylgeranylglycerol-phosphate geranylgeranyltransferase [Candidatus Bathyarchaeia archaeon]|nr:geranylgeranylglycerol-phosphate geranylgeranyltransferase [Candidatus Bathyarchaeota archaeon]